MTVQTLFAQLRTALRQAGQKTGLPIDAAVEADEILRIVCGLSRQTRLCAPQTPVGPEQRTRAMYAAAQRETGEPLGYVLGVSPFFGEDFLVCAGEDRTLIPRSDTEILVQALIDRLQPGDCFLDLCCGSGCVALAALRNTVGTAACGVDADAGACRIACRNAERLQLSARFTVCCEDVLHDANALCDAGKRCDQTIRHNADMRYRTNAQYDKSMPQDADTRRGMNVTTAATDQYHYIVANPPYIPTAKLAQLDAQVRREPRMALDGGPDGLFFYRAIMRRYRGKLRPGGAFLFEIGYDQRAALLQLAEQTEMRCDCLKDFAGHDRVVILQELLGAP